MERSESGRDDSRSLLRFAMLGEHRMKTRLHHRPLVVDHAVIDSVARDALVIQGMFAEDAFLFGADPEHCVPGPLIQHVRLELDAMTTPGLERMLEHEELRLRVHARPLIIATDPGPSDLDPAMPGLDVSEARASRGAACGEVDRGEGNGAPLGLLAERLFEVTAEIVPGLDDVQSPAPEIGIERDRGERIEMVLEGERLEPDRAAREGHRSRCEGARAWRGSWPGVRGGPGVHDGPGTHGGLRVHGRLRVPRGAQLRFGGAARTGHGAPPSLSTDGVPGPALHVLLASGSHGNEADRNARHLLETVEILARVRREIVPLARARRRRTPSREAL